MLEIGRHRHKFVAGLCSRKGSNPFVSRKFCFNLALFGLVAQLAEQTPLKREVAGSMPVGSILNCWSGETGKHIRLKSVALRVQLPSSALLKALRPIAQAG